MSTKSWIIIVLVFCGLQACKKDEVNLMQELQEGGWRFQQIKNDSGNTILSGEGEPALYFFFLDNDSISGRMRGTYALSSDDILYFQAEIYPFTPIYGGEEDSLANYPQRYYDFESITENGIEGKVEFVEKGWDSKLIFHYETDRKMIFRRH